MEEIPEEALETFDFRDMWNNLYELALSRNWHAVKDIMDETEQAEFEIWEDRQNWKKEQEKKSLTT